MTLRAATYGTLGEAHGGHADARRDVAAVRRLYRLHRELATDLAALERRRRLRADALMAVAVLLLALTGALMVDLAPRCTGAAPPSAGLTIGDAIKVAGCKGSCSTNKLERDDDSKKGHHALGVVSSNDVEGAAAARTAGEFP